MLCFVWRYTMKSMTIHGVDSQLAARLEQVAASDGTSMNRTIKRLLEEALGMKPKPAEHNREQFEAFLGVWSAKNVQEFEEATAELAVVDDGDWR
jgi:hypothetical protein